MKELKSGFYFIKNNKVIPITLKEAQKYKDKSLRLVSKDFNLIDIENFNNCILWTSNTPINLSIEITEVCNDWDKECNYMNT